MSNGREALEYLHTTSKPNVILLDLMMPVMDGWEFRRQQKADPAHRAGPRHRAVGARSRRAPPTVDAEAFLKKPLDFDRLLELVRDHCR